MSKKAADDAAAAKKKKAPAAAKVPAKKAAPAAAAKKPAARKSAPAKKAAPAAGRSKRKPASAQLDLDGTAADHAADTTELERAPLESTPVGETRARDSDEDGSSSVAAAPAIELTEEEKELQSVYGEEIAAPATAHAEYRDRQTSDEDRPMLPEITARDERNKRWDDRRDQRRRRRDERDQRRDHRAGSGAAGGAGGGAQVAQGGAGTSSPSHQGGGGGGRPGGSQSGGGGGGNGQRFDRSTESRGDRGDRGDRPQGEGRVDPNRGLPGGQPVRTLQPPVAMSGHEHDALARVGTPLGDAAATVFAQLRNGQPLPLRQLAQMMRKRNLVEHEPDQLAPQLKAELLGDERSYRALGLRPRIVYRGRDLFAPGPVSMSVTAEAEAELAASLSRLAGATHRALAARIAKATPAGFERLVHAYLVAAGYREIEWVKRTGGIAYAQATAPGIDRPVLISARSGDEPIDRRGIGELRVGVEAKNLVAGVLFSARELSEEAERELERPGRSVAVMCGDHLVAALIASGVGVVSAAAPMHYVDDSLLDELLAG